MYFNRARIDHEKSKDFTPFDPSTLKIPRIPRRPIAITKKHVSFVSDAFDISRQSYLQIYYQFGYNPDFDYEARLSELYDAAAGPARLSCNLSAPKGASGAQPLSIILHPVPSADSIYRGDTSPPRHGPGSSNPRHDDEQTQIVQNLHEKRNTTPTPERPPASSPLSSLPRSSQPQPPSSPFIPVPPSGSGTDPFTPLPMEGVEISGRSGSVAAGEWDLLSIVFRILS